MLELWPQGIMLLLTMILNHYLDETGRRHIASFVIIQWLGKRGRFELLETENYTNVNIYDKQP